MSFINELNALSAMSQKYGANKKYVLAGGGNTSYKSNDVLYIKGSGTALATIKPEQFVKMDRALLAKMWETEYPANEAEREAAVLADMMNARLKNESGRPSVETLLHDLFPQKFILHVHPASINGITCSVKGKAAMLELFPDADPEALTGEVLELTKEGVPLAAAYALYQKRAEKRCADAALQNAQNAGACFGSVGRSSENDYFTPDEVRAMTRNEVRANYQKIIQSMKSWS